MKSKISKIGGASLILIRTTELDGSINLALFPDL